MPQSKWDQFAAPDTPAAPAASGVSKWDQYAAAAPSAGDQIKSAASSFGGEMLHNLNPASAVRGLGQLAQHPIDTLTSGMSENRGKISGDLDAAGKSPGLVDKASHYGDALVHGIGGTIPLLGPAVSKFYDNSHPDYNGKQPDPAEFGKSMADVAALKAVPGAYEGVGRGLGALAPKMAETAMRVQKVDRAFGKTPGKAIIDETSGVRPETVAASARSKIGELTPQYEGLAAKAPPVDLSPAVGAIDDASSKAATQNAGKTVAQLEPLRDHLTKPIQGFTGKTKPGPLGPSSQAPSGLLDASGNPIMKTVPGTPGPSTIDPIQPALSALQLKRGLSNDFIHNWSPDSMPGVKKTAAKAYHQIDKGLDSAIPEGSSLNQRISSLIPVAKRAESTARNTDTVQRMVQRFAPHTGALLGGFEGYRMGGIPGAIAGVAIPEMLSSPTTQMVAARGANAGGKLLRSPTTKAAVTTGALTQRRKDKEQ